MNNKRLKVTEYMGFLSVKYKVYISELFNALVNAKKKGKCVCDELLVEYRGSVKGEAIFLITKQNEVIAQFKVLEEYLLLKNICFESWLDSEKVRKEVMKQNLGSNSIAVDKLRHGMKKVNLEGKIVERLKPMQVYSQYGNNSTLTNAYIADETGKVKLCLWNDQGKFIQKGDTVQVKGASVSTFKGERQLRLGRSGEVKVLQKST